VLKQNWNKTLFHLFYFWFIAVMWTGIDGWICSLGLQRWVIGLPTSIFISSASPALSRFSSSFICHHHHSQYPILLHSRLKNYLFNKSMPPSIDFCSGGVKVSCTSDYWHPAFPHLKLHKKRSGAKTTCLDAQSWRTVPSPVIFHFKHCEWLLQCSQNLSWTTLLCHIYHDY